MEEKNKKAESAFVILFAVALVGLAYYLYCHGIT